MTYRQAVQIQINALMKLYDNAEGLRDVATNEEREAYNEIRRVLPHLWQRLQNVDNSMSEGHAQHQLRGNYSISVNEKDI